MTNIIYDTNSVLFGFSCRGMQAYTALSALEVNEAALPAMMLHPSYFTYPEMDTVKMNGAIYYALGLTY